MGCFLIKYLPGYPGPVPEENEIWKDWNDEREKRDHTPDQKMLSGFLIFDRKEQDLVKVDTKEHGCSLFIL
jgi:hypothetical protein